MYANIELQEYPPLLVDISLYGANEDTYYKVTGIHGAFNRVLMNCKQDRGYLLTSVCLTTLISTRSCSAMESAKSFCGQNTWRTAVLMVRNRSCIPSSAITSSRMSRNDVLLCISTENLVNRLKWIGQAILQQSLTRIPEKSSKLTYLLV